jgi:pimeloyl-ACP methyl ester carboxylesterase
MANNLWAQRAIGLAVLGLAGLLAGCGSSDGLRVKEVGSYHVGGRTHTLTGAAVREITYTPGAPPTKINPNGDLAVEQMYTRYTRLVEPRGKVPLLMWHGGGLAGVTFETKPDGGPGWEMFFLKAGWDVYVSDAVERGRASWARYPEIFKTEPVFRTGKEAWELFRFGKTYDSDPAKRVALPGTLFPTESFEQFTKQGIPRWATNDAATQAAYDEYVEKACPCVILVHSQGGNFAFNAALKHPDKVKAIVAVETSGSPDPARTDFARLRGVPMLWVWGDYLEGYDFWRAVYARQEAFRQGLQKAGGRGDAIVMPQLGVKGNSHMLMMDRNSDQVAQLIQTWLAQQGLVK